MDKVKLWLLFIFFFVFQFSGGVYMAAVSLMSGSLSLMHEDIVMAGYATLIGLCLTFTIMYRLKSAFSIKKGLQVSATGLIVCNLITLNSGSVPVLVGVSFISGIFKMWGTFMCNTTISPWIFPKWTMGKFQCYVQTCVMSFMLLSGLITVYLSFFIKWQYVHLASVGILLCMLLLISLFFTDQKPAKRLPLYGIDWMGAILIGAAALSAVFVLNYGNHYDWFHSIHIRIGTTIGIVAMALNVWRASFVRHPYISNSVWHNRHVRVVIILLFGIYILVSPSNYIEQIYTGAILGYDSINQVSLNFISLGGYICGGLFAYHTMALRNWKFRRMTLIAISLVVFYLFIMYFTIDFNLGKSSLYLPIFIRSAGMIMLPAIFLTAIFTNIHFQNFFQALNIVTIVTACCGPLLGSAFIKKAFETIMKKNTLLLGTGQDNIRFSLNNLQLKQIFGTLQEQAMMVSIKEIYGWLLIAGVLFLIFCILYPKYLYKYVVRFFYGKR